jgi:hypothetical protein
VVKLWEETIDEFSIFYLVRKLRDDVAETVEVVLPARKESNAYYTPAWT